MHIVLGSAQNAATALDRAIQHGKGSFVIVSLGNGGPGPAASEMTLSIDTKAGAYIFGLMLFPKKMRLLLHRL